MLLLHTTEAAHYVTNDEKKKPYTNKIYDSAKGGIDIPDQRMVSLTCKEKKKKTDTCGISLCPWYEQQSTDMSQQLSNTCNEYKGYKYKKLWIRLGIDDIS